MRRLPAGSRRYDFFAASHFPRAGRPCHDLMQILRAPRNPGRPSSRRDFLGRALAGAAAALAARPARGFAPSARLRERLRAELARGPIFNTHEHLVPEAQRLRDPLDIFTLISHYAINDVISAGLDPKAAATLTRTETPLLERWKTFEPYWRRARNTGYCRVVEIVARDLCGVEELSAATCERVSDRLRQGNTPGLYRRMLEERMKVEWSVLDDYWNVSPVAPEYPRFVTARHFDRYALLRSREDVERIAQSVGREIGSFSDLCAAQEADFENNARGRMACVKSTLAYNRILHFRQVSRQDAERAFDALPPKAPPSPYPSARLLDAPSPPLGDHMVHRVLALARERNLPVQFHTGIHAGNGNYLTNSNPTHLINLCLDYPDVRFDLFHSGYPWVTELGAMAKTLRNVTIDLTWMHIISPATAQRALLEYLDTVPLAKIFGFGGDYRYVENSYGHLVIALDNVARTLAAKIESGDYSEQQALAAGRQILHQNPVAFFSPEKLARP